MKYQALLLSKNEKEKISQSHIAAVPLRVKEIDFKFHVS